MNNERPTVRERLQATEPGQSFRFLWTERHNSPASARAAAHDAAKRLGVKVGVRRDGDDIVVTRKPVETQRTSTLVGNYGARRKG